jgi:polyvinyl alcohol dehydrogenase (cytochrome)
MQILTNGPMRTQAAGLAMNDRVAVATYLTGSTPSGKLDATPEGNRCTERGTAVATGPSWNGWGRDLDNSRYQPDPGLAAADVPHLKVKWAFGYRATYIYGQPTIVGGRVYVTSSSGRVYSLDADTGIPLWKHKLDPHPDARITGAPVVYRGRVYVPVSSLEELSAPTPGYECCQFRGSVVALDAGTGQVIWQTYTIDRRPMPYRKAADGTQLYGPAGGSVWSAPTLDPRRGLLYVGTGNSYTDVPTARTDSILALSMTTGAIVWANQLHTKDNYIVSCDAPDSAGKGNCPQTLGPDVDFGTSPILQTLPDGRQMLLTGEKSGQVYALDPGSGKQFWSAQVGAGSSLGGIEWGSAADGSQLYVAVSDAAAANARPGGLVALRIEDGQRLWQTDPPAPVCSWGRRNCLAAQSQAVSAIPGVVLSGSEDGHLRAYASADGRVIWDFDTAQPFATVNGVAGVGGSLDNGGATIAGGMVYVNSGYGRIVGQPGNLLLAFGLEGR